MGLLFMGNSGRWEFFEGIFSYLILFLILIYYLADK